MQFRRQRADVRQNLAEAQVNFLVGLPQAAILLLEGFKVIGKAAQCSKFFTLTPGLLL